MNDTAVKNAFLLSVMLVALSFIVLFSPDSFGGDNTKTTESNIPQLQSNNPDNDLLFGYAKAKETCGAEDINILTGKEFVDGFRKKPREELQLTKSNFRASLAHCIISFEGAKKLLIRNKSIFIDVRSSENYQKYHISQSLNIPLHQIKTKSFLKNKPIVIVGNGYYMRDELLVCADLKEMGFSRVSVLDGGLLFWDKMGGSIAGVRPVENQFYISPEEYNKLSNSGLWTIIDATKDKKDRSHLFPGKKIIKYSASNMAYLNHSEMATKKQREYYLIVGVNKKEFLKIIKSFKQANMHFVFLLDENGESYYSYVKRQNIMLSKIKSGPIQLKPCGR